MGEVVKIRKIKESDYWLNINYSKKVQKAKTDRMAGSLL